MDVKGYQAIGTAFNSLVHLFEAVELQQKSISLDPDPQTPSHLQNQHNVQQVTCLFFLQSPLYAHNSVCFISGECR